MAQKKCPVCGVSVKLENLERHLRNQHPRADVDLETAAAGNDTAGSGSGADAATADVGVSARLRGEDADKRRHTLLTEIKAVTFHRLSAAQAPDGTWRATVLLDI